MQKYNPLFKTKYKHKEQNLQPKVIQNIVNQTQDNVVINKLSDNYILVGKDQKIISSQYKFQDFFKEVYSNFPIPLIPGGNVKIQNNEISVEIYDDTILLDNYTKCHNEISEINNNIDRISDHIVAVSAYMNVLPDKYNDKICKLKKNQEDLILKSEEYNNKTDLLRTKDQEKYLLFFNELDEKIDEIKKNIDISEQLNNQTCNDLLQKYNVLQDSFEKLHMNNTLLQNKINKEMKKNYETLEKKLTIQQNKFDSKYIDLCTNVTNNYSQMQENFYEKLEQKFLTMEKTNNIELASNQEEIQKLRNYINNVNQSVVLLKDSDPNSKILQKTIKVLTDKISKIDKYFKKSEIFGVI